MEGHFTLGPWLVQPRLNTVVRNGTTSRLTPKAMEVLACLARHAGEPVEKEALLQTVWSDTFVGDDVLKRSIAELRRVLEDDAKEPRIIETIAKRGYRVIAPVEWVDQQQPTPTEQFTAEGFRLRAAPSRKLWMTGTAVSLFLILVVLAGVFDVGGLRTRFRANAVPQIHSIAVLPLRNLSADPNQEYLCDGLTDGLITDLAQIGSLKVISHTSTMQYKDTQKSLPEIARELDVDGIVEGTVQKSGDRVRITAQLIHGPSDKHFWANSYQRDMRDVFALERDVTQDIASEIQARVTRPGQVPVAQVKAVDPKVLEAYLQGSYHMSRNGEGFGRDELEKAAEYFRQAIDADPNFAPAYDGLASTYMNRLWRSREEAAIERRAAEKAVELDPNYSEGQATLGFIKWQPGLDWRGAEENFRRAIALNSNNANAHFLLGLFLMATGRVDEGLPECNIAQRLDPNQDNSSWCLFHAHDYDGSIAILRAILRKDPNDGYSYCGISADYTMKGMGREAIEELAQCYSLFGFEKSATEIRHALAASGYFGAIRRWAEELEHLQAAKQVYLPGNLAVAYTILGDKDRAFYWLEQAYEHKEMVSIDGGVFFLGSDPMYDPLRSDPRYKDLLRRVGLPP